MAEINIDELLRGALKVGASDVHLKSGSSPVFRVNGKLIPIKEAPQLNNDNIKGIAFSMMNSYQR